MREGILFDPREVLAGCWPAGLLVGDAPGTWAMLLGQIVELEELLAEVSDGFDDDAAASADHLRRLLASKRDQLRAIDVGNGAGPARERNGSWVSDLRI